MNAFRLPRWIAFSLVLAPTVTFAWPSVPLPERSRGEAVTKHMKYNGLDMRASTFETLLPLDKVTAFYREQWPTTNVVDRMGNKTIVGHAEGDHYVTVELESAGGGTKGTIGVMLLPKKPVKYELGQGFPRPGGTTVINDIRYLDTPNETRTLVMQNRMTPFVNYQFFQRTLRNTGWSPVMAMRGCTAAQRECVVHFQKSDGGKLAMTLTQDMQQTTIVANLE